MVGIMNLDKQITSFLTVELITDCEIVRISADVLRKLAMENIETVSYTHLFPVSADLSHGNLQG